MYVRSDCGIWMLRTPSSSSYCVLFFITITQTNKNKQYRTYFDILKYMYLLSVGELDDKIDAFNHTWLA